MPDPAAARPLPMQRAFVVRLHATAAVAQRQLSGRVGHVLSGQAAHFHTLAELLAFSARVLARPETTLRSVTFLRGSAGGRRLR